MADIDAIQQRSEMAEEAQKHHARRLGDPGLRSHLTEFGVQCLALSAADVPALLTDLAASDARVRELEAAVQGFDEQDEAELAQVIFEAAGYSENGDPERNAARAALNWVRSRGSDV